MAQMRTFEHYSFKIDCVCVDGIPWFTGKDVATVLGYVNTAKAINNNVDDDDKQKLEALAKHPSEGCLVANSKSLSALTNQVFTH